MEQFKLNILTLLLSEICVIKGNNRFTNCVVCENNLSVLACIWMFVVDLVQTWYGSLIDTSKPYILILV